VSDSETFLSRWIRLKGQSDAASAPIDTPSPVPFDPASLPPLHAIVADTDMQQFMHEAVPEEVTRAALRSAWTADPAVRDFVGIAENQWDFNDQTSMPGFGPIEAADYLATQALRNLTDAVQIDPEDARSVAEMRYADSETKGVDQLPVATNREEIIEEVETVTVAASSESTAIDVVMPRTHGRAMPR
jgi:Protein of unknown function (DUF3306)